MDTRDEQLRTAAVGRLKRRRAFWMMLATYLIMNTAFIIAWALTGAGYFWPGWVLLGWGIALAFSAVRTFGPGSMPDSPSEQQIEEEMRKMDDRDAA
jgi:hypothetical protein